MRRVVEFVVCAVVGVIVLHLVTVIRTLYYVHYGWKLQLWSGAAPTFSRSYPACWRGLGYYSVFGIVAALISYVGVGPMLRHDADDVGISCVVFLTHGVRNAANESNCGSLLDVRQPCDVVLLSGFSLSSARSLAGRRAPLWQRAALCRRSLSRDGPAVRR